MVSTAWYRLTSGVPACTAPLQDPSAALSQRDDHRIVCDSLYLAGQRPPHRTPAVPLLPKYRSKPALLLIEMEAGAQAQQLPETLRRYVQQPRPRREPDLPLRMGG